MNYNQGWHVLYVKSFHEKKVYDLLLESAIDTFLPMVKIIREWKDRKKTIFKPLFPSYIFVNINSSIELQKAVSVTGACKYIRLGDEYAKVTDSEINKMKLLIDQEDITDIEINVQLSEVGDLKRINYGSLCGLECEVLKLNNANKIVVRIDSLVQNITATLPSNYFEAKEAFC